MWSSQRNLSSLINNVIANRKYDLFPILEEELNKNSSSFIDILKNVVSWFVRKEDINFFFQI